MKIRADRVTSGDVVRVPALGDNQAFTIELRQTIEGKVRLRFRELGPVTVDLEPDEEIELVEMSRS